MNSASLCSLAGRYNNPVPTWFLVPIDCLKIPALTAIGQKKIFLSLIDLLIFTRDTSNNRDREKSSGHVVCVFTVFLISGWSVYTVDLLLDCDVHIGN
jgi:hypothetical protein